MPKSNISSVKKNNPGYYTSVQVGLPAALMTKQQFIVYKNPNRQIARKMHFDFNIAICGIWLELKKNGFAEKGRTRWWC